MSIRSAVTMYFDTLVEPMFQRDDHGRDLFFPMGMGSKGSIVPDAATGARLRMALRRGYQVLFFVLFPIGSAMAVAGTGGLIAIGAFVAAAVVAQLSFTSWLARGLETTDRRMTMTNQTASIATAYSGRYIRWMAIISAILTIGGILGFVFPALAVSQSEWGRLLSLASALFFAAITVMWLRAGKIKAGTAA